MHAQLSFAPNGDTINVTDRVQWRAEAGDRARRHGGVRWSGTPVAAATGVVLAPATGRRTLVSTTPQ